MAYPFHLFIRIARTDCKPRFVSRPKIRLLPGLPPQPQRDAAFKDSGAHAKIQALEMALRVLNCGGRDTAFKHGRSKIVQILSIEQALLQSGVALRLPPRSGTHRVCSKNHRQCSRKLRLPTPRICPQNPLNSQIPRLQPVASPQFLIFFCCQTPCVFLFSSSIATRVARADTIRRMAHSADKK